MCFRGGHLLCHVGAFFLCFSLPHFSFFTFFPLLFAFSLCCGHTGIAKLHEVIQHKHQIRDEEKCRGQGGEGEKRGKGKKRGGIKRSQPSYKGGNCPASGACFTLKQVQVYCRSLINISCQLVDLSLQVIALSAGRRLHDSRIAIMHSTTSLIPLALILSLAHAGVPADCSYPPRGGYDTSADPIYGGEPATAPTPGPEYPPEPEPEPLPEPTDPALPPPDPSSPPTPGPSNDYPSSCELEGDALE